MSRRKFLTVTSALAGYAALAACAQLPNLPNGKKPTVQDAATWMQDILFAAESAVKGLSVNEDFPKDILTEVSTLLVDMRQDAAAVAKAVSESTATDSVRDFVKLAQSIVQDFEPNAPPNSNLLQLLSAIQSLLPLIQLAVGLLAVAPAPSAAYMSPQDAQQTLRAGYRA